MDQKFKNFSASFNVSLSTFIVEKTKFVSSERFLSRYLEGADTCEGKTRGTVGKFRALVCIPSFLNGLRQVNGTGIVNKRILINLTFRMLDNIHI